MGRRVNLGFVDGSNDGAEVALGEDDFASWFLPSRVQGNVVQGRAHYDVEGAHLAVTYICASDEEGQLRNRGLGSVPRRGSFLGSWLQQARGEGEIRLAAPDERRIVNVVDGQGARF